MKKTLFFQSTCLSFLAGIIAADLISVKQDFILILIAVGIILLVINLLFFQRKIFTQIIIIIIFCLLGIIRYQINLPKITSTDIQYYNNESGLKYKDLANTTFIGMVNDNPQRRVDHQKLIIKTQELLNGQKVSGKVLIKVPLYPRYNYGDLLEITCALQNPTQFEKFNYQKYLARFRIYSVCYNPEISLLKTGQGNYVKSLVLNLKLKIEEIINENLIEPQASILLALLIGVTYGMDPEVVRNFNLTGTSHIIAISGMHITLIANYLMNFFISLGCFRKTAFYLTLIFIFFYLVLCGFLPSAVRAAIMGLLVLLALNIGRLNLSINAILFAALVMVIFNPLLIITDIGFQFSFLAVLGLIYFQPAVEKVLKFLPQTLAIRENMATTLAAQVFTLPWLVFKLSNLSIISPIANLLILPLSAPMIIFGFLAVFSSFILPIFSQFIFWFLWLILGYFTLISEKLVSLNFAYIMIEHFSVWVLILIYLIIIILTFYLNKSRIAR